MRSDRSQAIDFLRGVAVLMVMFAHLPFGRGAGGANPYPNAFITNLMSYGHYGVQLFLMISGYCIHIRWARKADVTLTVPFLPFWRRRLTRLYPPYLVVVIGCVALTIASARLMPGAITWTKRQLGIDIVVLLLLAQNLTDSGARVGNPPFWSLALEEQLYLLYFPLLAIRRRRGWAAAFVVSTAVTLAWAFGSLVLIPDSWKFAWNRVGPSIWVCWVLGALVAEMHAGKVKLPAWSRSPFLFLALLVVGLAQPELHVEGLLVTLSFFPLIQSIVYLEMEGGFTARWLRPMVWLGEISYGVYLVHNPVFALSKRVLLMFPLPAPIVLVLRFGSGLLAGYILYLLVERPFMERSKRISVPLQSARP